MLPFKENKMSNVETRRASPSSGNYSAVRCKVCQEPFDTLQDCLAHELLRHSLKPQKKLRKCLDAITKLIASEEIQSERRKLYAVLALLQTGQHLRTVIDFFSGNGNKLSTCYNQVRDNILRQLQGQIKVFPFGSLVTGLTLKDSDIDLFLEQIDSGHTGMDHQHMFNKVYNFFRRSASFQDVFAIRHARVPIIRCKHVPSGLSLDINMSSPNSTYNSRFVADLVNRDIRVRDCCLFLKIWAKKLNIIGHGSMTSYCLIVLIIFGMQQQGQLPSIRDMQQHCGPMTVMGVNYGYSLHEVQPLPESLTTLDLITNFFEIYSRVNFEKKVLSPYLGYGLDAEAAFSVRGAFPEYESQLRAIQLYTGRQPEPFRTERCVCVQDPFELQHNVGQSISQTNLCYLQQCFALAAQACNDVNLKSTPAKFYDFLLFGLAEKLLQEQQQKQMHPAKQRKQSNTAMQELPSVVVPTTGLLGAAGTTNAAAEMATAQGLPTKISIDVTKSLMHAHTLTPTNNDLKSLRPGFITQNLNATLTLLEYWAQCYVDAIQDILSNIYAFKMKSMDSKPTTADKLPQKLTWLITASLDTWTARSFQRNTKTTFFAHHLEQTMEFRKIRTPNAKYAVNVAAYLVVIIKSDFKEIRIEVHPMPGDALCLQRHSPLTKFFRSLKNILSNFNFKEKAISVQYET